VGWGVVGLGPGGASKWHKNREMGVREREGGPPFAPYLTDSLFFRHARVRWPWGWGPVGLERWGVGTV